MTKYTAESLKVCRLADIAHLMNNLEAQRDELLAALRDCLTALRDVADTAGDVEYWNAGGFGYETAKQARATIAKVSE